MYYLYHNVNSKRFSPDGFLRFWRGETTTTPRVLRLAMGGKIIRLELYEPEFEPYLKCFFAPVLREWTSEDESGFVLRVGRYPQNKKLPVDCGECRKHDLWKYDDGKVFFLLNPAAEQFFSCDLNLGEGMAFVANGACLRLETLLFRIGMAHGQLLLHAGAVGLNGRGVLLCGQSGQGKSTTALSARMGGLDFISDDMTLLDSSCRAVPLYSSCRVSERMLTRYPGLRDGVFSPPGYVPLDPNKMEIDLWRLFPESFRKLEIKALVLPVIDRGRREPQIEKWLTATALLPLVYSSFFQFHDQENAEGIRRYIAALHRLNSYKLYLCSNYQKNSDLLKSLIQKEISDV